MCAELGQDRLDVGANGMDAQHEAFGDRLVAQALGDEEQDLAFASRESGDVMAGR